MRTESRWPVHPAADLFPLLSGDDYNALRDDIKAHGQREPITLYRGSVLDGRNRLRVCLELGLEPVTREWEGDGDPVAFVVSLNLQRRHLTPGQRATIAVEMLPLYEQPAKERQLANLRRGTQPPVQEIIPERESVPVEDAHTPKTPERQARNEVAKLLNVNPHYVTDAKALKEQAPDLFNEVRRGSMTIPDAKREQAFQEEQRELAIGRRIVEDIIAPSPRVQDAALRYALSKGIVAAGERLFGLNPERCGDVADHRDDTGHRIFIQEARDWLDRFERRLSVGLRLMGG